MISKLKQLFSPEKPMQGSVEYIIAGLGNPGREYEATRHNVGFMALDCLAVRHGKKIDHVKFKGLCAEALIGGKKVLLIRPMNFMNRSGESLREAMAFYKVPPEKTIVIFDDISLPPGKIRIRRKGSDGGHNGMKNIIYLLGSDEFPRVKIGVGEKPHPDYDLARWVLSRFDKSEAASLEKALCDACDAAELLLAGNAELAMQRFN